MRSYSYITSASGSGSGHYVELLESKFMELLRQMVAQIEVDEGWYCKMYRDVDDAVKSGAMESARAHYINAGYFENRFPRPIKVNEHWYLEEYPDVAMAIEAGAFSSASQHFERDGFREGRLPSENWSLIGARTREMAEA